MMKAVIIDEQTREVSIGDAPKPTPKPNEVLIRVHYTAANRADLAQREGKYPAPMGASSILGLEVSGTIEDLGAEAAVYFASNQHQNSFKLGDQVMALLSGGGYAQYTTCHYKHVMKVPIGISLEQAAAIPEVFLTAFQTLFYTAHLQHKNSCLIHAAASGVGTAAIQLAKFSGKNTIVTTCSKKKVKICQDLGATCALCYDDYDDNEKEAAAAASVWRKKLLEKVPQGVDVILDCIGKEYFEDNAQVIALDGQWVIIAMMTGNVFPSNPEFANSLFRKRATLTFSTLRSRSDEYKADLVKQFLEFVGEAFVTGELKPIVDKVFELEEVAQAHDYMKKNLNIGKIVMSLQKLNV